MTKPMELPDCNYPSEAVLVPPCAATPRHSLYLSNLDDQPFLRFTIRYLYIYKKSICAERLKSSLARVLVDYYPLAGRLQTSSDDPNKLEVECNGQGALFAEGFLDWTAAELVEGAKRPNRSWRKLLYRVDQSQGFLGVPPLVIHVIHLSCGGVILCTAINHRLCDGTGASQFLHAWAQFNAKPSWADLAVAPFHCRHILKPRNPPRTAFSHPEFTVPSSNDPDLLSELYQSQPLVPVSVTFAPDQILHLKKLCVPSFKCTSFEVLASHIWRAWACAMDLPAALNVKLLFSVNARKKLNPELPRGYYGNGFVLGCAESSVDRLITSNAHYSVKLIQQAKERVTDGYVRSVIDLLEEKRRMPDLSASLVISQWAKMGLEELDFGEGRPMHVGPVVSEIYGLLAPVVGDLHAFTMIMSVPQGAADRFEHLLGVGN